MDHVVALCPPPTRLILPPNAFGHGYAFRRNPNTIWRYRFAIALCGGLALGVADEAIARIHRSYEAKAAFKRAHHCPSTGLGRGPCPGWQVDHRIPLKCFGPDEPSNMQWLTIADHAAKTAREARSCRRGINKVFDTR